MVQSEENLVSMGACVLSVGRKGRRQSLLVHSWFKSVMEWNVCFITVSRWPLFASRVWGDSLAAVAMLTGSAAMGGGECSFTTTASERSWIGWVVTSYKHSGKSVFLLHSAVFVLFPECVIKLVLLPGPSYSKGDYKPRTKRHMFLSLPLICCVTLSNSIPPGQWFPNFSLPQASLFILMLLE